MCYFGIGRAKESLLINRLERQAGCRCIEGAAEQIRWINGFILAKRRACFRGDPDGWMVIDVGNQSISGPLTDDRLCELCRQRKLGFISLPPVRILT